MSEEVKLSADTMIVSETDAKGIIQYANTDFCKIAGYSKEELIGKPHNFVRHQDMPKAAFADLWKTIKAGNIWNGIVKNKTKDGGYYWVNATAYPSKNSNGVLRYVSVRVKPTDKEIEDAISLYKTLD
ncbi:MAG: PAS domain-containing protein [Arcobacter sp.]|uniref:PAS domain-containing protein n=1 Tax=Arcobacter sp. TaxID=1872629 RepID=UPI003AFFB7A2